MTAEYNEEYRPRRSRRKRKKDPIRTVFFTLLGLVVVAAIVAGGYVFNLANTFNNKSQEIVNAFPEKRVEKAPDDKSVNILLLGSDSRAATGQAQDLASAGDGGRSDTMMLMHIPGDRENVYVMSIMRDVWTSIPGYGEHKINAAMSFGGVPLVVETIEGLFDTRVDHVAMIDLAGFKQLTDALGGVELNNPIAFNSSHMPGRFFAQGPQLLNGDEALAFVRERYAYSDGDYQRVRNQQIFVKAVMSKFLTAETLTNPVRINEIVGEFSPFISVDNEFDAMEAGSLGFELRKVRSGDVQMFTLPTLGTGTSADGQSIVLRDDEAIAEISDALKTDTLSEYLSTAGLG